MVIVQSNSTKKKFSNKGINFKYKDYYFNLFKKDNKNSTPNSELIKVVQLPIYWSQPQKIINASIKDKEEKFTYKFSRYVWHTSYSDLFDKLGLSKESIRKKLVRLEELGILKREFKTVVIGTCEYHSMMFLRLSSNFLRSVTGSSKISHLKNECSLKDEYPLEQQAESSHSPKTKPPP